MRQGNADVPDFELIAFQVVSGMRAVRRSRAPAAAENEEWVLQIRLNGYLQYLLCNYNGFAYLKASNHKFTTRDHNMTPLTGSQRKGVFYN